MVFYHVHLACWGRRRPARAVIQPLPRAHPGQHIQVVFSLRYLICWDRHRPVLVVGSNETYGRSLYHVSRLNYQQFGEY